MSKISIYGSIRDISIADAGEYTVYASNGLIETERKLTLRVEGKY